MSVQNPRSRFSFVARRKARLRFARGPFYGLQKENLLRGFCTRITHHFKEDFSLLHNVGRGSPAT